ncbi:LptA/OstA family protein [Amorphus sp. 3PC139-8]|uniref:LptA/OstA family protein n=1 Tax=Amorphus sp. 3PC139-8 TaxID=2735676 RepID=UPI00345D7212
MTPRRLIAFFAMALVWATPLSAQTFETGFSGLGGESNEPIQIESDELEVRDQEGLAIFSGSVVVVQGDSRMKAAKLIVHYEGGGAATSGESGTTGGQDQQISSLEATGGVVVTSKEQTATGDTGNVDMKTNILELNGNVTLTQGPNVVNGDKLTVDLATGRAKVLSDSRVRVLLVPNSAKQE